MFDVIQETRVARITQRERHRLAAPIIQSVTTRRIPFSGYLFHHAHIGTASLISLPCGLLFGLDFREQFAVYLAEFEMRQQVWSTRTGAAQ